MHVPGWHEATRGLQAEGKLQMVGIIQEQHPDRARLFMQWKQMGWPVLVDSLNLLGVSSVPVTLALDEEGVIREVRPPLKDAARFAAGFARQQEGRARHAPRVQPAPPAPSVLRPPAGSGSAERWRAYAYSLLLWQPRQGIGDAVSALEKALELEPDHAPTWFRLGVAYRMRYDSDNRRDGDFSRGVRMWTRALEIDPNNYIWRRRIQQYGPRLEKPYPFFDWVPDARLEIRARGEEPVKLHVEPGDSEFAEPLKTFEASDDAGLTARSHQRVWRDDGKYVTADVAVVPPSMSPGATARVHVSFRPNLETRTHWNNEVEELALWIRPPEGWQVDQHRHTHPNPGRAVSQETRALEFEVRAPPDAVPGTVSIPGYALYYVCEDVDGTCLYRRKDLLFTLQVR